MYRARGRLSRALPRTKPQLLRDRHATIALIHDLFPAQIAAHIREECQRLEPQLEPEVEPSYAYKRLGLYLPDSSLLTSLMLSSALAMRLQVVYLTARCAAPCRGTPSRAAPCRSTVHRAEPHHAAPQCHFALQRIALHCRTALQRAAPHHVAAYRTTALRRAAPRRAAPHCAAVCHTAPQHAAAHRATACCTTLRRCV